MVALTMVNPFQNFTMVAPTMVNPFQKFTMVAPTMVSQKVGKLPVAIPNFEEWLEFINVVTIVSRTFMASERLYLNFMRIHWLRYVIGT